MMASRWNVTGDLRRCNTHSISPCYRHRLDATGLLAGKAFCPCKDVHGPELMTTKCSHCGTDNPDGVYLCKKCGRLLAIKTGKSGRTNFSKPRFARQDGSRGYPRQRSEELTDYRTIPNKMRLEYAHAVTDPLSRVLDGVRNLLGALHKSNVNVDGLLQDAADLISRQLGIENVAIGLRDPRDGLYRYRAMVGFREDAIEAHKQTAYRREQFFEDSEFIGHDISKLTRLYLTEDNVLSEQEVKAFNRPGLLGAKRCTASDSLEGDYIDVKILGVKDELLGWIEISGTRTMKLPDATVLKWVEAIASIIAAALIYKDASRT